MAFTLVQIGLPKVATVGQPPGKPHLAARYNNEFVGLLDHLVIALAGIPSTLQRPTLLDCSHSYVCNLTSPTSHTLYVLHIAATSLMQPQMFGPMVTALDRFHFNTPDIEQAYILRLLYYIYMCMSHACV